MLCLAQGGVSDGPGGFCHAQARNGEDGSGALATEQRGLERGIRYDLF